MCAIGDRLEIYPNIVYTIQTYWRDDGPPIKLSEWDTVERELVHGWVHMHIHLRREDTSKSIWFVRGGPARFPNNYNAPWHIGSREISLFVELLKFILLKNSQNSSDQNTFAKILSEQSYAMPAIVGPSPSRKCMRVLRSKLKLICQLLVFQKPSFTTRFVHWFNQL